MSYNKILKQYAVESGYNSTEIIEKCRENNMKIDKSYYSKILNGKLPAPSEEYSRTFAKIFEKDERVLILEGYLDKAPKEVTECLNKFKELLVRLSISSLISNNLNNINLEDVLNEIPTSTFMIEILDTDINTIKNSNNLIKFSDINKNKNETNINFNLSKALAIPVEDNSMFPLIPKNSKIILELKEKYQNGDILAIKTKDFENAIVRYTLFNNENIILTSLNKDYETLTYKLKNIEILGKVNQVITNI